MLTGSVKTGDFTLTSGKKSSYYVNVKEVYTDPVVLKKIAEEMARLIRGREVDKIAGIAIGAVPLAVALSFELGIPFLVIRKQKREHGTTIQVEGGLNKGDRIIVVEDVVTTGGSVIAGIDAIRKEGMCDTVIAVVDREEGASELLKKHGIELISLATAKDLTGGS